MMKLEEHARRLEKLKALIADDRKILRIAICGGFNSGKTSLLNLLLGLNLPVKTLTTTRIITKIHTGNRLQAEFADGWRRTVSQKELNEFISIKQKTLNGVAQSEAVAAWVGCQNELLQKGAVEFWDTPGLADDETLDKITASAVEQCDVVIYVMDAARILSKTDKYFLAYKLKQMVGSNIIVVINKMDLPRPEEMREIIEEAREVLADFGNRNCGNGALFTSANPQNFQIKDLANRLRRLCTNAERRSACLLTARNAKIKNFSAECLKTLEEDIEELENNFKKLSADFGQSQLERFKKLKRTYLDDKAKVNSEINYRICALEDIQMLEEILEQVKTQEDWEKNYVELSSKVMREAIEKIFSDIETIDEGLLLYYPSLKNLPPISTEKIWTHMDWGENFDAAHFGGMLSGALAGAAAGSVIPVIGSGVGAVAGLVIGAYRDGSKNNEVKKLFQYNCVNDTIQAWLKFPCDIAKNIAEDFRENLLKMLEHDFTERIMSEFKSAISINSLRKILALSNYADEIKYLARVSLK